MTLIDAEDVDEEMDVDDDEVDGTSGVVQKIEGMEISRSFVKGI